MRFPQSLRAFAPLVSLSTPALARCPGDDGVGNNSLCTAEALPLAVQAEAAP